jgi:magnesium and cobalt transporter
MTDTSPAAVPGPAAEGDNEPSSDSNGQRGLFGRLIGALGSPDEVQAGKLESGMRHILPGLAALRRMRVADVAVPKAEIVAVPEDMEREALIEVFRQSGFSRLPVYRDTLDKPLGLLLLKDLVLNGGLETGKEQVELGPILRRFLFVPPSMPLMVLMQKMQTERTHMALVIDEYGGVDGLVTIEDVLEQIVGQIDDEYDTEDEGLWQQEGPGVWLIQARATLEDLIKVTGLDLEAGFEDEEIETLGGLVFLLAGRVPARGEVIAHPSGAEIEVLDADPRRVKRLRLRLREALAEGA